MFRITTSAIALALMLSGAAQAETFEVHMLNKGEAGAMVFEPGFVRVGPGDTVKFIAKNKGHNAESIDGMMPEGAAAFQGKINEEIEVTFEVPGLYGVMCKPHFAMGMAMTIAVGDISDVPEGYFEGRLPKKAKERMEAQTSGL